MWTPQLDHEPKKRWQKEREARNHQENQHPICKRHIRETVKGIQTIQDWSNPQALSHHQESAMRQIERQGPPHGQGQRHLQVWMWKAWQSVHRWVRKKPTIQSIRAQNHHKEGIKNRPLTPKESPRNHKSKKHSLRRRPTLNKTQTNQNEPQLRSPALGIQPNMVRNAGILHRDRRPHQGRSQTRRLHLQPTN